MADQNWWSTFRHMRTLKWYIRLAHHTFNAMAANVYVIRRDGKCGKERLRYSVRQCKLEIVEDLRQMINAHSSITPCVPEVREAPNRFRLNKDGDHWLEALPKRRQCVVHKTRKRIILQCKACKLPMCAVPCHERYHSLKNYKLESSK